MDEQYSMDYGKRDKGKDAQCWINFVRVNGENSTRGQPYSGIPVMDKKILIQHKLSFTLIQFLLAI